MAEWQNVISSWLGTVSGWVWGPPLVILLTGTGLFYMIFLRALPLRFLYYAFRITFGLEDKKHAGEGRGELSYFRALAMTLSATVGTGNIVGVASAILIGGPGALFWMWVTAILGMATKFGEAVLAVHFREKTEQGFAGGPMYYIEKGLKQRWLGILFAIFTLIAAFGIGNMVQIQAAASALSDPSLGVPRYITAIAVAFLTAMVIIGGVKRIGLVAGYVVPIMAFFYLIAAVFVLATNASYLPRAFSQVIHYAFHPLPLITGGGAGILLLTIRSGVQRGLFSNEAGLGSTPIADASAKTNYAVRQGLVAMLGPFFDTLFICSLTGFVIIVGMNVAGESILGRITESGAEYEKLKTFLPALSGYLEGNPGNFWPGFIETFGSAGAEFKTALTAEVFLHFLGPWGKMAILLSLSLFAVTTVIGWYYYSDRALVYLGAGRYIQYYRYIYVFIVLIGGLITKATLVWNFSDIANGLMAFPNLIALLLLSPIVARETKLYFQKYPGKYGFISQFYIFFLWLIPKRSLSGVVGKLARWHAPRFIMQPFLLGFAKFFHVRMDEAELELKDYKSLNEFFTRSLKNEARTLEHADNAVLSPVDGTVLSSGKLESGGKIYVKGNELSLSDLVHSGPFAHKLAGGNYIILYLSPGDYHRIHVPVSGKITGYNYIPGTLYPVNEFSQARIDRLLARNERLTTYLESYGGFLAIAKIGATSVGKIIVNYPGFPPEGAKRRKSHENIFDHAVHVKAGEELGRFEMGSTVILLFEHERAELLDLREGDKLNYGQPVAYWI